MNTNGDSAEDEATLASENNAQEQSQNFRWSPESIYLMLRLRYERHEDFQCGVRQKKSIWNEIAAEMNRQGEYVITGEICDLKYRNMLQTYKKNLLKEKRGMQAQIGWEYYDLFKEAMKNSGESDDLVPSQLCESVCANRVNGEQEIKSLFEGIDVKIKTEKKRTRQMPQCHSIGSKRARISIDNIPNEESSQEKKFDPHSSDINVSNQPLVPNVMSFQHNVKPPWLADAEFLACRTFGDSVGLQLATIKDSSMRALLIFKIQEQIYLATIGKLSIPNRNNIE